MADSDGRCCGSCEACLVFCCPCYKSLNGKYSGVKYSSPSSFQHDPAEFQVPMQKMTFEFSQPPAQFPVHPQIKPPISKPKVGMDGGCIIDKQPRLLAPSRDGSRSSREGSPINTAAMATFPTIQYSLYYDMQRNVLAVHLQQVYNLPTRRKSKSLDTVVTLYLTPHKEEVFESKVVQRSLNPLFGQNFEFTGQPGLELTKKQVLIFKVYEHTKSGLGELMGVAPIKLENADLFGETTREKIQDSSTDISKLQTDSMGDILISLTYLTEAGVLKGLLLKATNLKQQDIAGTADPYVKVSLCYKGKNVQKWKSSIKKNTLSPVFKESFQFSICDMDTNELHLNIVMMDYDRFSRDDTVGIVRIGADIPEGRGRTHWEEVMSGCNEPISRWHQISPL